MMGTTLEAPSAEAQAETEKALAAKSLGEMSIGELVELARGADEDSAGEAVTELEARADDDIEEAAEALTEFVLSDDGRAQEPGADSDGGALPTAADDDGSDVDLSEGIHLQLPGLEGGLKLSFQGIGGKRPEESEFRVVGGGFKVSGQFEKGQDVFVELRTRVTEVAFSDVIDNKTAQATTSKRKHKGRVIGAVVIDDSSREKLDRLVDGFSVGTIPADEVRRILGITLGGQDELGVEA